MFIGVPNMYCTVPVGNIDCMPNLSKLRSNSVGFCIGLISLKSIFGHLFASKENTSPDSIFLRTRGRMSFQTNQIFGSERRASWQWMVAENYSKISTENWNALQFCVLCLSFQKSKRPMTPSWQQHSHAMASLWWPQLKFAGQSWIRWQCHVISWLVVIVLNGANNHYL